MDPTRAVTLYADMALVRAVDTVMTGIIGRSYERGRDAILRAITDLERERSPHGTMTTCAMCGSALVPAQHGPGHDADHPPRRGGVSSNVVLGAGLGAVAGAVVAAGWEQYLTKKRSRSDKLVAMLREQPGRPIGELARELYGDDSESTRSKTRALLAQLGRLGRARNVGVGRWEAVDEEVPET